MREKHTCERCGEEMTPEVNDDGSVECSACGSSIPTCADDYFEPY